MQRWRQPGWAECPDAGSVLRLAPRFFVCFDFFGRDQEWGSALIFNLECAGEFSRMNPVIDGFHIHIEQFCDLRDGHHGGLFLVSHSRALYEDDFLYTQTYTAVKLIAETLRIGVP